MTHARKPTMFEHLQIQEPRERAIVGLADLALRVAAPVVVRGSARQTGAPPRRILLLRLERIGDLVMALDAIALVRAHAAAARIDLVVGSWNAPVAALIADVDRVETLDPPWMARESPGSRWPSMLRRARRWRARRYDLAINFEGDIRSNLLLGLTGAPRRVGFEMAGGGALLTDRVAYDPVCHVSVNAARLVARAFDLPPADADAPRPRPTLTVPDDARRRAAVLLARAGARRTLIGLQPGAGRAIKEWDPARLGWVGAELARDPDVSLVVTGSAGDRTSLSALAAALPANRHVVRVPEHVDLVVLSAILERLALFITGDTGPMHLAAAVGTPVLAIFGPSLPTRYAPLVKPSRIVRIDLPCSPCNRLRHPPPECVGHIPDCLAGIEAPQVLAAARELLGAVRRDTSRT